jgi:hypothetical protein
MAEISRREVGSDATSWVVEGAGPQLKSDFDRKEELKGEDTLLNFLGDRIVAVDGLPENTRAIPILDAEAFRKLAALLTRLDEPWLALKYKRTIILMWRHRAFTHHLAGNP